MKKYILFFTMIFTTLSISNIVGEIEANKSNEGKKRILIGSPVHQKPNILKEFLESLENLNKDNFEISYYFVDDNAIEESSTLLKAFIQTKSNESVIEVSDRNNSEKYTCNETTHFWSDNLVAKVAGFKNNIIKYADEKNFDYLFLIDSDMVLNPKTLKHLVSVNKDIVSNIFWTSWQPNTSQLPNAWLYDLYTLYRKNSKSETVPQEEQAKRSIEFLSQLKQPGTYEVGGLCGCTLVSNKAIKKGASFKDIKNLTFWGEDRYFCIRATVLEIPLYIDTHYPAFHIYRESDLNNVEEYKQKNR